VAKAQEGRGAPPPAAPGPTANAKKYAWPAKPAVLSTRVKRLDGPDKVTGRAKYSFDINRPGMIFGKIVRSPHPHAKVLSVDLTAAQRAPGVRAALVWKEPNTPAAECKYQGDPVAAIAADTEEQAEDAARLVKVTYDVLSYVPTVEQAMESGAPAYITGGSNTRQGNTDQVGDLDAGFKQAAHVVEQTYSTHVITHVCMETHGCVCEWDGDKLTAWVSTQGVHGTKDGFAQGLKIPGANVRVITQYMGGGFGSKFGPDAQGLICAQLAKQAGKPVKLFLDRKEEHLDSGNRPSAYAKIKAGVSADGKLVAFDAQSWGTGGAGATSNFPLPYIYNFPNRRRVHTDVYINAGQQRAMRAPGHPQGCFLTEILMDELADRVRMDPVKFRIQNLPTAAPSRKWADYFEQGAKAFGWDKRHATGDPRPGPIKNGFGVSAHQWGGGGRGGRAHVDITSDGSVVMKVGTQDLGTGTRTMVAMLTAETFGLPVTADMLVAEGGRVFVKGTPAKGMTWKEACRLIGTEPISVDGQWEDGLSSTGTSGVQFTEVDVDIETGIVKVKRILSVQDCGLIVSRLTAESQVYGGIIGSLNFALFEDRIIDRVTGHMVNPNMESYLLAGMSDVPKIDIMLVDTPEQRERGVIGIGEPPTVSTASSIANAIRNATGATVRSLPLHPHKILQAIEEQKAGGTL